MNKISRDIFKAIHEGKWISVEYQNKQGDTTNYWIGIKDIDPYKKKLIVDGFNVATTQMKELVLFFDSIRNTNLVDGSYYETPEKLINDIEEHPSRYQFLFQNITNLKLLEYYEECSKLDNTPYQKEYTLIDELDIDVIGNDDYLLNDRQFQCITRRFHNQAKNNRSFSSTSLCMNLCSVPTKKGLYVLAYRKLYFDVKNHALRINGPVTICREFTIDGEKYSASYFLDADEMELLDDYESNAEVIKDLITKNDPSIVGVDDMPYLIALSRDFTINLKDEYEAILNMYQEDKVSYPIKAFFGDMNAKPRRTKEYPIALYNDRVNLDQLLVIHHGMKYPVLYVQGPPGSGKTNTILNTVITAFFNAKTVLITSYNNHPVDEIYEKLSHLKYNGKNIPFPILRLGNNEKVYKAIESIRNLYNETERTKIYDSSLTKKKNNEEEKMKELRDLLEKYERMLDLQERKEMIEAMTSSSDNLTFTMDLKGGQLHAIEEELKNIGEIKEEDVLPLISNDREELLMYLYYTSAKFIKRINEPRYSDLKEILFNLEPDDAVLSFNEYISNDANFQKLLRIFPIIATTNISAHKLGDPKAYFDMVIMDEASQCNTAVALIPIIRGHQLILVGDPQQLKPVIVLDDKSNHILMKKYHVKEGYDYKNKSVYETFLAADAVSDEVLLSNHYRCHEKIIEFNNKKYYNNKLNIKSNIQNPEPLEFIDCKSEDTNKKNTSIKEVDEIIHYIKANKDKSIGVITPFVNQKKMIQNALIQNGITNVDCGTVHAFQGDEKQEIIFSLALSHSTASKTYGWLKNNKELINVATSRAKEKLIVTGDYDELSRLHNLNEEDDLYELCDYVRSKGRTTITTRVPDSRALGIKPYSTETESAFLTTLNHAINTMMITKAKYVVKKEVAISQVFMNDDEVNDLFYTGRFDYIVYEQRTNLPIFAIELDGEEHTKDDTVIARDKKKQEICDRHHFTMIRVPNNYARRYNYAKEILSNFFENARY